MSKAQLVIAAVVVEGRSKSEVARDYDVSRQSELTPVAVKVCTPTTRPFSRTLSTSASAATNVYGPSIEGSGAKRLDLLIELGGHDRDL